MREVDEKQEISLLRPKLNMYYCMFTVHIHYLCLHTVLGSLTDYRLNLII